MGIEVSVFFYNIFSIIIFNLFMRLTDVQRLVPRLSSQGDVWFDTKLSIYGKKIAMFHTHIGQDFLKSHVKLPFNTQSVEQTSLYKYMAPHKSSLKMNIVVCTKECISSLCLSRQIACDESPSTNVDGSCKYDEIYKGRHMSL